MKEMLDKLKLNVITFSKFLDHCEVKKGICFHCQTEVEQIDLLIDFLNRNAFNWIFHYEAGERIVAILRFAAIEINYFDAYSRDQIMKESIVYGFEYMEGWWMQVKPKEI